MLDNLTVCGVFLTARHLCWRDKGGSGVFTSSCSLPYCCWWRYYHSTKSPLQTLFFSLVWASWIRLRLRGTHFSANFLDTYSLYHFPFCDKYHASSHHVSWHLWTLFAEHRHVGSNNFNLLSSRSHTIFTMVCIFSSSFHLCKNHGNGSQESGWHAATTFMYSSSVSWDSYPNHTYL